MVELFLPGDHLLGILEERGKRWRIVESNPISNVVGTISWYLPEMRFLPILDFSVNDRKYIIMTIMRPGIKVMLHGFWTAHCYDVGIFFAAVLGVSWHILHDVRGWVANANVTQLTTNFTKMIVCLKRHLVLHRILKKTYQRYAGISSSKL